MISKTEDFLKKFEAPILIALLAIMLFVNSRDLAWGLPSRWNPDELAGVVNLALSGLEKFDQTNFDYPSLPKYFMYLIGIITDGLGHTRTTFTMVVRFMSVFLGAMTAWLAYALVRQSGGKRWSALLAALLVATNSELALNAHFAHNDLYVTFFVGMTLLFALKYVNTNNKAWLYFSFYAAGLAASSKYNGGGIVIVALLGYLLVEGKPILHQKMKMFETFFVGAGLSILGYGTGTHTALTSFSFYIKRLMPALWRHANYNRGPDSTTGLFKQWGVMQWAFGEPAYIFFMLSVAALLVMGLLYLTGKLKIERKNMIRYALFLGAIFILDLPILASYNVQTRFFLPLLAPLAVVSALMFETLLNWLKTQGREKLVPLALAIVSVALVFSGMRVASTILTIHNDSRITAKTYLDSLPVDAHYELTFYSPNMDEDRFENILGYPLIFKKFPDQELPEDSRFDYNSGEAGVEERKPDYLVASSFIYSRFHNAYTCELHQADCDFFGKLLAGETNYHQIADFKYELPWYLPDVRLTFMNPEILVFQRVNK